LDPAIGQQNSISDLIVDLRGLLRGLHEHRIDYVVSGALSTVFSGYVRNTEDLDIAVNPEPDNLDRVTEWRRALSAGPPRPAVTERPKRVRA